MRYGLKYLSMTARETVVFSEDTASSRAGWAHRTRLFRRLWMEPISSR